MIVGGSGEFAHRTGTWDELDIQKPGYPALGTFEFEMHVYWDQKPKNKMTVGSLPDALTTHLRIG